MNDYEVLEKFEAGLALLGHEVKSIRDGGMSLRGAYVAIAQGKPMLIGAHVPRFSKAGELPGYDPDRSRVLLLHRRELQKLVGKLDQKGLTLVPISVYTKGSKIKVEVGLARGKREFEKRESIKKRDTDREVRRILKNGA